MPRTPYFFLVILVTYFAGMALHVDIIEYIFKPLIVTSLLAWFISSTGYGSSPLKKWTVGALLFSIIGDTVLLFANKNELYFILGLLAFLIAHLFYILCFHNIKKDAQITGRWYTAIIVAGYFSVIMSLLIPHLGGLKIPVVVYGLVISFMMFVAMQLYEITANQAGKYIVTGAVFFIASDSILAINKFYNPLPWGAWTIMGTYTLAQFLIVSGIIRYLGIATEKKQD